MRIFKKLLLVKFALLVVWGLTHLANAEVAKEGRLTISRAAPNGGWQMLSVELVAAKGQCHHEA